MTTPLIIWATGTASELTLDTDGIITVGTNGFYTVDTFEDAASDSLVTISGGYEGQMIILRASNDARTVILKHNTGNIWLQGKADISLDDIRDGIMLFFDGTKWIDIAPGTAGAASGDFKADGTVPLTGDIDFAGTQQCHDLQAPAAAGEAIRQTATITEASLGVAVTIGIADDNMLQVDDATAADDDFARFTAAGIEGIPAQTALSTLLAAVLLENDSIKLDPALSADGKWNGITETGTAGATLAFGDLVYFQTADSRWELASSDNAAAGHNLKLGICVLAAANDASATNILLWGKVRADTAFPALTIGAPVFMSTTAGDVQTAAPSGTTDIVRIVGYGNTADELFFCPENDYLELV